MQKGVSMLYKLVVFFCYFISSSIAFACDFKISDDKSTATIQASRVFMSCELVYTSKAIALYSCGQGDVNAKDTLTIDKSLSPHKGFLNNLECQENKSGFINFCLISGAC